MEDKFITLGNLSEYSSNTDEKIREFAASEQFETYKKLFDELGLINK